MGGAGTPKRGGGDARRTAPEDWARALHENLPVHLSARLATGRIPLGVLRQIGVGSVVPLSTPVGEPARLTAGGAVIGAGEIVDVLGRLGLRLTKLGSSHD